ncbi:hypothetical protein bcere0025_57670 [Bacillus cereus F65185]|nr:hypothetical protein bcere0025_57670 [Bacillus cereus F65185]
MKKGFSLIGQSAFTINYTSNRTSLPGAIVSVAGIEIARLEISLQVALTLIALGIPICA